jgi:hypothetical protein
MADPLGLVYTGQDATGAAFKAPWTSYDPYQAELMKGQAKLAMMQEKKKADEKQKEDALKLASTKAPNWTKYIGVATNLQSKQSDWITKAFTEGRQNEVAQKASLFKTFNDGLVNAVNSNYTQYLAAQNAVNRDAGALRDVASENFTVFENPEFATENYYPGVAEAYNRNLEAAKQRMSALPEGSYDEDDVRQYAALLTQNEKRGDLLQVPKQYPVTTWMPVASAEAAKIFNMSAQGDLEGKKKTLTKEVKEEEAKRILDRFYQGDIRFENQMRYEFNRLTPEEQAVYENPRKYAQDYYYKDLVAKSDVESGTGGINIGINMGAGERPPVSQQYEGVARKMPAGQISSAGVAKTTVSFPEGAFAYGTPGQQGELDKMNIRSYVNLDETKEAGTLRLKDSVTPVDFRYQNGVYLPTVKKDFVVRDDTGNVISAVRAGSVMTEETFDIIKKHNYTVPSGHIEWEPWAEGAITYKSGTKDVSKTVFAKWQDVAPLYASYVNYRGKNPVYDLAGEKPSGDIYDYYGINKPSGASAASPTTTRKTIKESEIAGKAKNAGYSESEYRKLLQQKGIQIEK